MVLQDFLFDDNTLLVLFLLVKKKNKKRTAGNDDSPLPALYPDSKLQALVQTVKRFSGVSSVTTSSSIAGRLDAFVMPNQRDNDPLKENSLCDMLKVDPEFIPAYQLQ